MHTCTCIRDYSIECPGDDVTKDPAAITLWSIMSKVRLEAMMWVCITHYVTVSV